MTQHLITNARLVDPEAGTVSDGALWLKDGKIAAYWGLQDETSLKRQFGAIA